MKLQLKDFSPYLPHNTMMVRFENGRLINTTTLNLTFLHEQRWDKVWKLALHPLSDLAKPIKVEGYNDGKEFVPIERLLDINTECNWSASDYLITENGKDEYWTRIKEGWCFGYNSERHFFYMVNKNANHEKVINQLELFQLLYQWHFDIEGLIESGLAIDINTLNKN